MCNSETILKYYKTSFIRKFINLLDVKQDSVLVKSINESFIIKQLNQFFVFSQNLFTGFSGSSFFVKNIDNLIFLMISLLMISIIIAPTGIIALFAVLSFALTFAKLCLKKDEKFSVNSLDSAIFLYLAIAGLSVAFSYMPFAALRGYMKMIIYIGSYLTFYNILKDNPKRTFYLLGIVTVTASAEAFYAVYQQIHGVAALASWQDMSNANPEQLMNRVYGTLKPFNPNLLAGYLIASLSSAAGMFFYFLSKKSNKLAVLSGIGTAAVLLSIVFTGSRGAYIALAGMTALLIAISGHIIWKDYGQNAGLKKIWSTIIASGVIAVILAVIASPSLQHRVASIFAARADSSNSFRINVWIASFKMFLDNFLIGIGPGNTVFRITYGFYMVTGFDALGAYCVPLEIAAESGIFALLAFLWLIFMMVVKSIKAIISNSSIEQKIILSSCFVGITGILLHGMVDTIFYRPQINIMFWMLMAVFAANMQDNFKKSA